MIKQLIFKEASFIISDAISVNNLSKFFLWFLFNMFCFYSLWIRNHIKLKYRIFLILPKRLTAKQKEEIVMSFKSGMDIDVLSQKYSCTNSTIIRNLKKNLGESKYKDFTNKSKSLKEKPETNKNKTNDLEEKIFDNEDFKNDYKDHKV